MRLRQSRPAIAFALCMLILLDVPLVSAQSLSPKAPSPLQDGSNTASVDSLIGPQYWYFFAEPGHFQLTFTQGGAQGLGASGRAVIQAGFSPKTPGATINVKSTPNGDVFSGAVVTRTRVGIGVTPPNSPLVRSTIPYTLAASGHISLGSLRNAAPPIVGLYSTLVNNPLGAVRFNSDGTIEASNGEHGTWELFDADSNIYVIVIDGKRMSLRLDPGRGLIDVQSGLIPFSKTR